MPAVSEKQARFMRAIAHGWKPKGKKKKDLPSKKVAEEFSHMAKGGLVKSFASAIRSYKVRGGR